MSRARLLSLVIAATVLAVPLGACSSDDEGSTSGGGATTAGDATGTPPCVSRMPGEQLTEAEAVVGFSRENVCPGYVTVAAGTQVTWRNDDTEPFVVDVTSSGGVIASGSVAPGETWRYEFTEAGAYEYRTDALPDFVGIVEVQALGAETGAAAASAPASGPY
jgi:plastocyanin